MMGEGRGIVIPALYLFIGPFIECFGPYTVTETVLDYKV